MKNYKTLLTQKGETWQEALTRYERFLKADMLQYFTVKDYSYTFSENEAYLLHQDGKVLTRFIRNFSEEHNINVPDNLTDLMCNYGTFTVGDSLLEIFNQADDTFMTLSEILQSYNYDSLLAEIGPGMLKSLNGFYFFFGISFPQTDQTSFLYFSKAGNFGIMHLSENNHEEALRKTLPSMFNGSIDKFTLDSLISNQIDRIIINALMVRGYID
ncbi:hypothetical protein M2132_001129 [Dysgonomonas sp. PH5-45]|uniref:hypothetical protein n=1 Tax=unclassified Dysgonomonas TaxID=2630389 RepID=UPI0024746B26|nr:MULTISPECIES: hypothetical protein [unclassified Dysgonomonas]MDH6354798.1 hypothetical protein [Dysgonomonas sp. PH5-45]MDH6387697.1 hypothetical protein [Dysgonomonas sp. PH5-37]